jgi:hypothetical protein
MVRVWVTQSSTDRARRRHNRPREQPTASAAAPATTRITGLGETATGAFAITMTV